MPRPLEETQINEQSEVHDAKSESGIIAPLPSSSSAGSTGAPSTTFDFKDWTVIRFKDELTGLLTYELSFPDGLGGIERMEVGNELSEAVIARHLRQRTVALPKAPATTRKFVRALLEKVEPGFTMKTAVPGWKPLRPAGEKFVRPQAAVIGPSVVPSAAMYRWEVKGSHNKGLGAKSGSGAVWMASVCSVAEGSSFVAFAVMCALAAPLLRFSELIEDPVFNLVGPSSVGKTTVAKVGASVFGHPDAIFSWDLSSRGLEEHASARNDCLTILNGAERSSERDQRQMLAQIVHKLPDGESRRRSTSVQEKLPDLDWRTIVLSTSNRTGSEMAGGVWDDQERVRFIDIAVPAAGEGGIFDRLADEKDVEIVAARKIRNLELALAANYGTAIRPWLKKLLAHQDCKQLVTKYSDRYLKKCGPVSGLEDRIARKFALVYAAGKIGIELKILPWPRNLPFAVIRRLHRNSTDVRARTKNALLDAIMILRTEIGRDKLIKQHRPGADISVANESELLGVLFELNGANVVGFRSEGLVARFGQATTKQIWQWLEQNGVLSVLPFTGRGQQHRMKLRVHGKVLNRPRLVVGNLKKLKRATALLSS